MSDRPALPGVLIAHGGMAKGMLDAVQRISGAGTDVLKALSNEGKSPEVLQAALDELVGKDPAVIFTDLASGSCALAARVCCREASQQVMISGVNLPMLLDFVFNRHLPLSELVPRLLAKGGESLRSIPEY